MIEGYRCLKLVLCNQFYMLLMRAIRSLHTSLGLERYAHFQIEINSSNDFENSLVVGGTKHRILPSTNIKFHTSSCGAIGSPDLCRVYLRPLEAILS